MLLLSSHEKAVLTSIHSTFSFVKETNFRGHNLTQNRKIPRESPNPREKICNKFLKVREVQKSKKLIRAGKPQKGSRAHRFYSEAESQTKCCTRFSLSMEVSRLTRDGTAEPVSRDQILRHARGQGNVHFPCSADHEQDWQPYPVDPYM